MARSAWVAVLVLMLLCGCRSTAGDAVAPATTLNFPDSSKLSVSQLSKWRDMATRHKAARSDPTWAALVASLRAAPRPTLLARVNREINRYGYVSDRRSWDVDDYWASPAEFLANGGDCEDFAIAKLLLLRELGVPSSRMRIFLFPAHAILVVQEGERLTALENGRELYTPVTRRLSRAVFAVNDIEWLVLKPRRQQAAKAAPTFRKRQAFSRPI